MKRLALTLALFLVPAIASAQTGIFPANTVWGNATVSSAQPKATAITAFSGLFANPTATIGLTAVNGTATTGLRSDSAPALSQAISPTMTGAWTFTNLVTINTNPTSILRFGSTSVAGGDVIQFATGHAAISSTITVSDSSVIGSNSALFNLGAGSLILTVPAGAPAFHSFVIQNAGVATGSTDFSDVIVGTSETFTLPAGLRRGASFSFTKKVGGTGNREALIGEYVANDGSTSEYVQGGLFIGRAIKDTVNFSLDVFGSISFAELGAGITGFTNQITASELDVSLSSPTQGAVGLQLVLAQTVGSTIGVGRNAAIMAGRGDTTTIGWKYLLDVGFGAGSTGGVSEFTDAIFHAGSGTIPYFFDFSSATASTASWKGSFVVEGGVTAQSIHAVSAGSDTAVSIDTTVAATSFLNLLDRGAIKWSIGRNNSNLFFIEDVSTGHNILSSALGSDVVTLGVTAVNVGELAFANLTSGTVTLQPVTGALGTSVLSLPAATDTLVGRTTTDTLTNKTLTSPTMTTPVLGVASATSLALSGTAGAGFVNFLTQSSNPSAPASGFALFAEASGRLSWRRQSDGFVRTFDATLTANRVFTLPDAAITIAGINLAQTWTATQTFSTFIIPTTGSAPIIQQLSGTGAFLWFSDASSPTGQRVGFGTDVATADLFRIYGATFGANVMSISAATGIATFLGTTDASSGNTGTIITNGGLGVVKTAYIGADLHVIGQIFGPNITQLNTAVNGTVCWTTGTGKFTVDTTTTCLASIGAAKNIISHLTSRSALDKIVALDPVSFRYKQGWADNGHYEQFGLIAEQVASVDERMVGRDPQGKLQGVRYMELTAVIAGAIKELKHDNDNLRAANDNLKHRVELLERRKAR